MPSNLISVVDDDESIRRTTKLLIESFGYRAAVFESAEVLLRSRQLHDTSWLIVDLNMPGISGLQLQAQLAARAGPSLLFSSALTGTRHLVSKQCKLVL